MVLAMAGGVIVAAAMCVSHFACRQEEGPSGPLPRTMEAANLNVLVEKGAHRLSLFDGNRLLKRYRAAVGGGRGDKAREGDRCTPEGEFFVCYRNPESKYTLSLGLSYPNEEDAARGLRDGLIVQEQHDAIVGACRSRSFDANAWESLWKTPLGGEIMIHGKGAGRDWTAGCVAVSDDDIRELYSLLPLGAPVRIVP
jgi:murein L,D-transpeptidase YafK